MTKHTHNPEKSMDEILDSIRKTISEDMTPAQPSAPEEETPQPEEVLELTREVMEDGSIVDLTKEEEAKKMTQPTQQAAEVLPPEATTENQVDAFFQETQEEDAAQSLGQGDLVSDQVMEESIAAISKLSDVGKVSSSLNVETLGSQTLENLMRELLRPMLKDWLDAHLPSLVKWVVTEEIEKIVKKSGRI